MELCVYNPSSPNVYEGDKCNYTCITLIQFLQIFLEQIDEEWLYIPYVSPYSMSYAFQFVPKLLQFQTG